MCNPDKGPSIDASYQVTVHLAKHFQNRRFFLEINQSETRIANLYREPSIDSTYRVTVHLAKQFQRRKFLEINQSQTIIACGGHVCERIGTK